MLPLEVDKKNIWQYKQNKPSLIAKDIEKLGMIPQQVVLKVLMARGVFKWFAARRDLIKLKERWKEQITLAQQGIKIKRAELNIVSRHSTFADHHDLGYLKGYHAALSECRTQVRVICHSERWRCQDNDMDGWLTLNDPDWGKV